MSFRYENYGTADLLAVSGTTVTTQYSIFGSAFYQTRTGVAAFPIPSSAELWIKFDVYANGSTTWRAFHDSSDGKSNGIGGYGTSIVTYANNSSVHTGAGKNSTGLHTILLHMVSGSSGKIEYWCDGVKVNDYTGSVNTRDLVFDKFFLQSQSGNNFFSNVIISDLEIGLNENATQSCYSDTLRKIINSDEIFRYENYGTADLLNVSGTTIETEYSKFGTAFYTASRAPSFPIPSPNEIWMKFDAVHTGNDNFSAGNIDTEYGSNTLFGQKWGNYTVVYTMENRSGAAGEGSYTELSNVSQNVLHTYLVHIKSGAFLEVWIDGNKAIRKEYNVNGGNDLDNIFIQSSGDSNLFSNVIISNVEIGLNEDAALPDPNNYCDTLRIIANAEAGYADVLRRIIHGSIQTGYSDLSRKIAVTVVGYSDTLQITANTASGYSDTLLIIKRNEAEEGYSDTLRSIANNTVGYTDTLRNISRCEVTYSDILRIVANTASGYSDTLRSILEGRTGYSDLLRIITGNESGFYDTSRNITGTLSQDFDAERIIASFIDKDFDAERILAVFINQDFDAERSLYAVINQDFDTEVKIPHTATISPVPAPTPSPTPTPVPQENTGTIRSISVTLNEQQVTDDLTVEAVSDYDIMELIQGSYLDYAFSMRIESMTCSRGITTARCCSDVDELLYTQLAYNVPQNERWHVVNSETSEEEEERVAAASTHIAKIAAALGKVPVLQFSDFISTMDVEPQGVTYADLIRELFGWTSSLPQMLINCYIRNDRLYVIQRGYEQNQIDLTNSKRTSPTIARELVRTTWGSDVWSKTETKTRDRFMWDKVDIEFYPEESGERNSEYTYDSDGLVSSSITLDETSEGTTKTEVYYHYTTINKRKFLSHEETIITYNSGTSNEETETRHVYHTPLNNGQEHVHGVDSDGEPIGSNVGNKAWNDKVSPYSQYMFAGYAKTITKTPIMKQEELQRTLYGISLIDTSFPVVGDQKLIELTNAIKWLNRKTMETVEFSVYDHPHLIDFNDRIVLDGNTYYLQSNSAIRDTRNVNRQNLRIVRWY